MPDYIPQSDATFNGWQANLVNTSDSNKENWDISDEDLAPLQDQRNKWDETYAVAGNKHNRTEADVTAKNEARAAYEKGLRAFVKQFLAFNPRVSDADRDRMGLTIPSGSRKSAPVPATVPTATVDFSVHLRHCIHFVDAATGRKEKPQGVHGCEVWTKVGGDAPAKESELTFLGVDTSSPYTITYQGDQQGITIYYWLRWVNTRGEYGPWSAPVSAVIA